jgi:WD40 repeat protein
LPERITALAWHPRLPLLAVAGGTPMQWGTVALVDATNLQPVRFLCDMPDTALSAAFSPHGERLAVAGADRTVRLFDSVSGRSRRLWKLHADWVETVAFNEEGDHLLTTSRDRTARVIDVSRNEVLASYTGHDTPLLGGVFTRDGKRAWTFARGGVFQRWNTDNAERKNELHVEVAALLSTPRGIVAIGTDRKLRRYEGEKLVDTWDGPDAYPTSAMVMPDGERIAIGGADGTVSLVSLADGRRTGGLTATVR